MTKQQFAMVFLTVTVWGAMSALPALAFMPINVDKVKHRVVKADPSLEDFYGSDGGAKVAKVGSGPVAKGFFPINRPVNRLPSDAFATLGDTTPNATAQRLAKAQPKPESKPESKRDVRPTNKQEAETALAMPARMVPFMRSPVVSSPVVSNTSSRDQGTRIARLGGRDDAIMDLFGEDQDYDGHPFAKSIRGSGLAWPISPREDQRLSSGFGKRKDPFTGDHAFHQGIDIVTRKGTPVLASADGVVSEVGKQARLGSFVTIDHALGVSTMYGHMEDIHVREGQRVRQGQPLGSVGMTGRTTGPHLHYSVLVNDKHVDPLTRIALPNTVKTIAVSSSK